MSWLSFTDMGERYPLLDSRNESSVEGLFLAGDVAATPDLRAAVNAGHDVAARIAALPRRSRREPEFEVIVIGAGPAGMAAALELKRLGRRTLVLERKQPFNALRTLGPDHMLFLPSKGERVTRGALPFDRDITVRDLLGQWEAILAANPVEIRTGVAVTRVRRRDSFEVETAGRTYLADRLIVAVGKTAFLRRLDAAAEAAPRIHYTPDGPLPADSRIVVVADCAHPEATALAARLSAGNSVSFVCEDPPGLHHRQVLPESFSRLVQEGKIRAVHGTVREVARDVVRVGVPPAGAAGEFGPPTPLTARDEVSNAGPPPEGDGTGGPTGKRPPLSAPPAGEVEEIPFDRVYALGGVLKTEVPVAFFRKIGLRFEGDWNFARWALFGLSFILVAAFYLMKKLHPQALMVGGRDLAGWYPFLYSAVVVGFGIPAIRRYRDPMQTQRIGLLIFFQVFFYCILPELILRNWKSYGLVYVWPLVLSPITVDAYLMPDGRFYFWWTLAMTVVALPVFVLFGGKRYCSYVCGCGGLAETVGDRWRHLSPKGAENTGKERALTWVTWFTFVATLFPITDWISWRTLGRPLLGTVTPTMNLVWDYSVNLLLISIIPIAAYPFLGGKIWCRYWCPVVGVMNWLGRSKRGAGRALKVLDSRFRIDTRRERCIACGMCDRYCEVGVPVMKHALKGVPLTMDSSSCIGCGLCLTVCPTDALKYPNVPLYPNRFISRPGW